MGYFSWKNEGNYKKVIPDYRLYLEDYVYEKVWSEMSAGDKKLAYGAAKSKNGKAKEIKKITSMSDNEYSVYRDRLIKRGIFNGSEHGYLSFTLPLFDEYVIFNYNLL